jgi:hypothetical protein
VLLLLSLLIVLLRVLLLFSRQSVVQHICATCRCCLGYLCCISHCWYAIITTASCCLQRSLAGRDTPGWGEPGGSSGST